MILRILAVDDEPLALEMLADAIKKAAPDAEVIEFGTPSELLRYAENNICDIAFLDIHMRGMTGIGLAGRLKEKLPDINIVFVTGYDEYAGEAMALHASGYIVKPVTAEKVFRELADLRHPV